MYDTGLRLSHFLDNKGITQQQVAHDLDVSVQYVNALYKGRDVIGKRNAAKLQKLYGINSGWLLTGEGQMYACCPDSGAMIAAEPEDVPSVAAPPQPQKSYANGKPYYNVDFSLGFDLIQNDQTQNPDYLIDFPPYNDCDVWCNATGNSMHPTISSGDIVALKRILDFHYLINGEIYAIVTSNGLRTIKRIRDNGDTFTLIPDNHTVGEQIIPKNLVTHAFHVRGCLKKF